MPPAKRSATSSRRRRQKPIVGDIVAIAIGKKRYGFGWMLDDPLVAYFDFESTTMPEPQDLTSATIAFRIWTMRDPITSGRWVRIGNAEPPARVRKSPAFFRADAITGKLYATKGLTRPDGQLDEKPISRTKAASLENAAVWSDCHVEDRLRDHFAGVPNIWVEASRVRPVRR